MEEIEAGGGGGGAGIGQGEPRGVGDAVGEPVPLTPEGIDALFDLWPMAEAFERLYLGPALLLDDENNVSAPALNGTSAAGQDIAAPAPR